MSKVIDRDKLGYLGFDYQLRLVSQILTDNQFASSIIDIIDPNYFEDNYLKIIVNVIKEAKQEHDIIPDIGSIEFRLLEDVKNEKQKQSALIQLGKIKTVNLNDTLKVQDIAMKFCKQQELKKAVKEINRIMELGDLDQYPECEAILRKSLEHGDSKDDGIDVFKNINKVFEEDFRKPIRTGIKGLDDVMNGGLAKGELGVILAPTGVGKTTLTTKLANTAMLDGQKVLQIFFEDKVDVIQKKHLSCWSGIALNEISDHKEGLEELVNEIEARNQETGGDLRLKKFSSDGTTIPIIRQYIRKLIASGFRPDLVLLDYIDCVEPSKKFDDINAGEGSVMRQFEALASDFNFAAWTAVQGNRGSIGSEVVQADQMGGSIKKAQIGHFIMSVAKTLDQKEAKTATIAILKSRFGDDGIIFSDIMFDNSRIQIEMSHSNSFGQTTGEYKKSSEENKQKRIKEVFDARQKLKENL